MNESPLGKKSKYTDEYCPELLFPISRTIKRQEIGIQTTLPFYGADIWTAYELSWLNVKGKPVVAIGEFIFPADSPNLVESKSLKLYLNSFNNSKFAALDDVKICIEQDLSQASGKKVQVKIKQLHAIKPVTLTDFQGICLDDFDLECSDYNYLPALLETNDELVEEVLYSNLLKSNCLVTGQPDWGSIQITYSGKKINHESLLKYLVSFRNHQEFHEQCVERIFMDLMRYCAPNSLTVFARYTRRGGLDINPYRSTEDIAIKSNRLARQ